MSEASLLQLLDRIGNDEAFRASLEADAESALKQFDLSQAELAALASNDEDGLRRLSGRDASGFLSYIDLIRQPGNTYWATLRPIRYWQPSYVQSCNTHSVGRPYVCGPC